MTLTEAKAHLRVDIPDDDDLINGLIIAAREFCETYQNRAYMTQSWEVVCDGWPTLPMELPRAPLQSVTSLKYKDSTGAETTWDAANYIVDADSEPGRIALAKDITFPTDVTLQPIGGVRIRYVVGYADAASVPQVFKQAMLLLIGHLYENREAVTDVKLEEVPLAVKALLGPDCVVNIFT